MQNGLKIGDKTPPFVAKDHKGYQVTDQDVIGIPLVLYFYQKDESPESIAELCAFRDQMEQFDDLKTLILGVSPDSIDSHRHLVRKNKLEFSLLSDPQKDMCRMFGVLKDDTVQRTTFVINTEGVIKWIERGVKIQGHVDRVIAALKEHCPQTLVNFDDYDKDYEKFLHTSLEVPKDEKVSKKKIMKEFGIKESDLKKKK